MKTNIFNPFTRIAGIKAFLAGFTGIILCGILCYLSKAHFDGVIDVHFGATGSIYLFLAEGLIVLASVVIIFSLTGLILVGTRFRFIDILGTMSLARLPMIIVPLFALILPPDRVTDYFLYTFLKIGNPVTIGSWDIASFVIMIIVMFFALIWTITLMYNAFRICMNTKGAKTVIAFIIALILAEALSKIVFYIMNPINIPLK
jgi:hypothetical protein